MVPLDPVQIVTAIILSKGMVWSNRVCQMNQMPSFSVLDHGLQHGHTLPNTQFLSLYFCNFLSGGQTLMHWPQRCCSGKGAERPVFLSMEVWNSGCGQCLFSYSYCSPSFFLSPLFLFLVVCCVVQWFFCDEILYLSVPYTVSKVGIFKYTFCSYHCVTQSCLCSVEWCRVVWECCTFSHQI